MKSTVHALFSDPTVAENAVGALLDHHVLPQDISVLVDSSSEESPNAEEVMTIARTGLTTTTAHDANVGAAKGAGWGLGIGAIAALGSIFLPGIGVVVGGGALAAAALATFGTAAAGAIAGGLTGFLKDQGIEEGVATEYSAILGRGGALVSVSVPSNDVSQETVASILDKYCGAEGTHTIEARPGPSLY